MPADVCPITKMRCTSLQTCQGAGCWRGDSYGKYQPMEESSLSKEDLYALVIAEQKAAASG